VPAPPPIRPAPPVVRPPVSEAAKTAAKVVTGAALGVIATKEAFAQTMLPQAQKASEKLSGGKIPPEALVAQWALESGWGKSLSGDYNYFGTKADKSWKGDRKLVVTREYFTEEQAKKFLSLGDGREILGIIGPGKKPGVQEYRVKDWFRSYKSLEEAVDDKTKFLIENKRYAKAGVLDATTSQEYFQRLQNAGYAGTSNVTYASTLMGVVPSVNRLIKPQGENLDLKRDMKSGTQAPTVIINSGQNNNTNVTRPQATPERNVNPMLGR
jgi:flagellum-specific peptidoglycan hydrolase FlgJ